MLSLLDSSVCITGNAGFLGRYVVDALLKRGVRRSSLILPRKRDFDLTQADAVHRLYRESRPEIVIHLAARVGGIGANRKHPGGFFHQNMSMGLHMIEAARAYGIRKFVLAGTVCAYPKHCPVPFKEHNLWNGFPEETNAPYGVAKKALFVMLDAYKQEFGLNSAIVVPVNLFGPNDNFDINSSHVIPALISKIEQARIVGARTITCWGTGEASREFLYVADAAEGILRAAQILDDPIPVNLGTGREIKIRELVAVIARECDYHGNVEWDTTKPDGQPRRCLDVQRAKELLNWEAHTSLEEGLRETIRWYRSATAPASPS